MIVRLKIKQATTEPPGRCFFSFLSSLDGFLSLPKKLKLSYRLSCLRLRSLVRDRLVSTPLSNHHPTQHQRTLFFVPWTDPFVFALFLHRSQKRFHMYIRSRNLSPVDTSFPSISDHSHTPTSQDTRSGRDIITQMDTRDDRRTATVELDADQTDSDTVFSVDVFESDRDSMSPVMFTPTPTRRRGRVQARRQRRHQHQRQRQVRRAHDHHHDPSSPPGTHPLPPVHRARVANHPGATIIHHLPHRRTATVHPFLRLPDRSLARYADVDLQPILQDRLHLIRHRLRLPVPRRRHGPLRTRDHRLVRRRLVQSCSSRTLGTSGFDGLIKGTLPRSRLCVDVVKWYGCFWHHQRYVCIPNLK